MERAASVLFALALTACALAAPTTASAIPASTGSAQPAGTVSASGPWTFTVDSSSKTTVRVREVLAQIRAPGDAVLTATGMKGAFTLNTDGTFAAGSKITTDLTTLRSDQSQRDQFIKDNTLQTRRFPSAEFAPTKTSGLSMPLALSGDLSFALIGNMTVHGVTKQITFAVKATRDGAKLTATATAEPTWRFGDFGMTVPRAASVLSVEDEIRVEIALVATETG
jgi:polyisoprenoid-binding protein YceI